MHRVTKNLYADSLIHNKTAVYNYVENQSKEDMLTNLRYYKKYVIIIINIL